ncbi:hypothetical protein IMCC26134_08760 [Verrucomicrobia bacterium IMCC26134]|nr:hypothetical protein IMCC26134_08760 [Verrucomicrobia bacterium IMCC26134]
MMTSLRRLFTLVAILAAGFMPHFIPSAQAAEIQVLSNNLEVVDGDSTPRVEDRTFFGVQTVGAGNLTQTFTIKNLSTTAGDNLNLTGTPIVVIGGANPGDFVVTTQPVASVAPGASTTFVITWTPTFGGIHNATLSIANNDSNETPYDFAIQTTAMLKLTYTAGANGSISGTTPQVVFSTATGSAVTAVPATGYHFVNWSDGSSVNPRTDTPVTANVSVTANFATGGYTLTYTAGANGSITGTTPQTVIHGASGTAVNAVPATGYSFENWSDGSTANPRTDTNVMTNKNVTANFAINTYTLTYTAGANGSISGTTPQTVNYNTSGTAVTAVAATGYHFVNWSDASTANPRTDTNVIANKSVSATFAINTYTLTYIAGPYGVIAGTTPQTVTHGSSGTTVTAVPAANARFVNWSDGALTATRTDTNVTAAKSVTAQFELKAPTTPVPTVTLNGPATVTIGLNTAYSELGAFSGPSALAAGDSHSLALRSDGTVAAWGNNGDGQTTITPGLSNVVALASGYYHNLALRSNGTVAAWGRNFDGQTTLPASLSNVVAISAGLYHNLALRSSGTVVAWGSDYLGQTTIPPGLNNVVAIAAGGAHSLALRYDGAVSAWGYGGSGQTTIPLGLSNVIAIAAGGGHSLALRYDGTVAAWGYGASGQTTTPAGLINVVAIAAGGSHSLALRSDGTVVAWGDNSSGQSTIPEGLSNVVAIAAGGNHSLALRSDGTVVAWGAGLINDGGVSSPSNNYGQSIIPAGVFLPATVSGSVNANTAGSYVLAYSATNFLGGSGSTTRTVMVGPTLTYTAGANGSLTGTTPQTVNYNASGTAVTAVPATGYSFVNWSDGSTANPRTDTNVTSNRSVTATFAINTFTLTYTAGANGTLTGTTPQTVNYGASGTAVTAVAAPGYHFVNWSDGTTGNPRTDTNVMTNVNVTANFGLDAPLPNVTLNGQASVTMRVNSAYTESGAFSGPSAISGASRHSLALRSDGTVAAWGFNYYGPTTIPAGLSNVVAVSAGDEYSLALRSNGTVVGWGYNGNGQSAIPAGLSNVTAIAAGGNHSLALRSDGTVVAWGSNYYDETTLPAGLGNVVAISAGYNHSLALRSDGTVVAWGSNYYGQSTIPEGLSNVVAIAAGWWHSLALRSDGTVVAWGAGLYNDGGASYPYYNYGQSIIPAGLSNVVAIAADGYHSLALRSDGTVAAWGSNRYGQSTIPAGLNNVVALAAGGDYSLALRSDGSVVAWGDNYYGQTTIPANIYLPATVSGSVDTSTPGNYVLTYNATNFMGGTGSTTRTVVVLASYTLTYAAGAHGSLTGSPLQTVDYNANGTAVAVVPALGYSFVNWSDGSTANPRTDTNVTANKSVTANFAINTYALTYTAGANGSLTGTTPQTVNYGASGTAVAAVPALGYSFVNWSDGSSANPRTDGNVTTNKSVTANFAINTYALTYTAGANGSLTGTTPQTVNYGASGTAVAAVPALGYSFVNWSDGSSANPRTDGNVTTNLGVTANFAINTYALAYTAGANGSLTGTTPQTVNYGSNGSAVTAVPATGYSFVNWSDSSTANPRTDTSVTANRSVTANFAINTYTLTYGAGANGSLAGTTPQTVDHGASGSAVTAVPVANYHFVNWSDGVLTAARTDGNVTANQSVTATFAIDTFTLSYTADANGSLTGTASQTVTYGSSGTTITAVPAPGYRFVNWSDGSTANPRTDTNVTGDLSATANYEIGGYTLTYTSGANGSLTGTTPQTVNYNASGTAVAAVANAGYHFVGWSDGSTANPRTDGNVTTSLSVTANFESGGYTLTYTAGAGGTLTGTTLQTVDHGTNGTAVTAVAAPGYHFANWSDSSTANPRTDTNVTASQSVSANFVPNTPTPPLPTVTLNGSATVTIQLNAAYTELGAFFGPSALAAGASHSLAVRSDGTVVAWGDNRSGQGTTPPGLSNVVATVAGVAHSLALRGDGSVVAWGSNDYGQTSIPAGLDNVVAISAGIYHNLALRSNGTVVAWGYNYDGQTAIPAGLSNVVAIAAGGYHSLALRSDGTVVAWGYNDSWGQTDIPAGLSDVVAIAAGGYHSLALRSDGTVVAWGNDNLGQSTVPAGLSNVMAIAAGGFHSLALRSDGTVAAWGKYNYNGNGSDFIPMYVPDELSNVVAIAAGGGHSLALRSDGTVAAWAYNGDGQTTVPSNVYLPATVSGSVDPSTPGSYVLTYSATNFLGGSSSTTRTVVVLAPLNLTYTAGAHGSITGTTSQTISNSTTARGTAVTAVPDPGYHFVSWSDGSTANPRTDTGLVADVTVTANFAIGGNTLTYTAGANGAITGATPQTVNHGSAGTTVTAVPATGYSFVNWSDGSPINPRTDTNVMMNVNVTASFRLDIPGNLDPDFYPDANGTVYSSAVQPDGKVLIGGLFTTVLGVERNRIARLNADGTLDMDFNPNASGSVFSLAVQADGKVLIGGAFTTLQPNGAASPTTRNRFARLNADGSLDMGFDPNASGSVFSVAVQADGKVLIGGAFLRLQPNGAATATARLRFARLNADGTLDEGFNPRPNGSGTSTTVTSVAVQADGKVLIGGNFRTLQPNDAATATPRQYIARLNADGTLDPDFNPNANNSVQSVAVQADGKVLIGGGFSTLQPNGAATATPRNRIARLNADGSLDMGFDPNANGSVLSLAVQADGKVLLGGTFGALQPNGAATATPRNRIARLNADGTLDEGFGPKANGNVSSLALQADGKVLIGGEFTTLQPNGAATATTRNRIARLDNDAATQNLSIPDGTQALWSRGGSAPELTRVTFEVSTDGGATWGTPIAGTRLGTTANWQATGLSLPAGSLLRARGVTSGGYLNSSSGLIEQVTSFSTLTYTAGANGTLTGTTPQWVASGANGTAVTAVPASGYHFVNWSDGSTANPRTDTNVTANKSVTANFLVDAPVVDVLSPSTGLTTGGTSVTLRGINFLGTSSVTFGGTAATIVSVTGTEITVTSPAHAAVAVNVVVTTPGGSSTDVATFTYTAPPTPVVDVLSPSTGLTTGGTSVTLSGINFLGTSSVTFGGTAATIVSVTGTEITVTSPAHAAGAVNVVVTTPGGSSTDVVTFTYEAAPLSALESWRQTKFGNTATNTGTAADAADPYHTGVPNLLVYAFFGPAQDPATVQSSQLPQATASGNFLSYEFTEPSGVSGLTYGAEWSATLGNDWQPVTDTGIAPVHTFRVPLDGPKKFLRLRVTTQ